MNAKDVIIGIDAGSQSVRVSVYDKDMNRIFISNKAKVGIVRSKNDTYVISSMSQFLESTVVSLNFVATYLKSNALTPVAMGITNQRETFTGWFIDSKNEMIPSSFNNLISWQSSHADLYPETCDWSVVEKHQNTNSTIIDRNLRTNELIYEKTGLPHTGYFSCSKIHDYLYKDTFKPETFENYRLGTVDALLCYLLTGNHFTDKSNAHRTNLFDITNMKWSSELLKFWTIPESILPIIKNTFDDYGKVHNDDSRLIFSQYKLDPIYKNVEIRSLIGDQQSSSYGHGIHSENILKVTLGTGGFISGVVKDVSSLKSFNHNYFTDMLFKNSSDFLQLTPIYTTDKVSVLMAENYIKTAGVGVTIMERLGLLHDTQDFDKFCKHQIPNFKNHCINTIHQYRNAAKDIFEGKYEHLFPLMKDLNDDLKAIVCKKYLNLVVKDLERNIDVFMSYYNSINKQIAAIHVDGGFMNSNALQQKLMKIYKNRIVFNADSELTVRGCAKVIYDHI